MSVRVQIISWLALQIKAGYAILTMSSSRSLGVAMANEKKRIPVRKNYVFLLLMIELFKLPDYFSRKQLRQTYLELTGKRISAKELADIINQLISRQIIWDRCADHQENIPINSSEIEKRFTLYMGASYCASLASAYK